MYKYLRDKNGASLPIVLGLMLIVMLFAIILLNTSAAETRISIQHQKKSQAHYLGRSGTYVGLDIVKNKLASSAYDNLDTLISELNTYISTIVIPSEFEVENKGRFTLSFERHDSREIKIISEGITIGNPSIKEVVTLRVKTRFPNSPTTNPSEWVTGINLQKGVNPDADPSKSYLGKAVMLEGNPVKCPKGSGSASTFRASMIYFTDYKGISLQQVNNTIPVTFDSSIVYFLSKVKLNNTNNEIKLSYSDAVANDKYDLSSIMYTSNPDVSGSVGFENYDYYKDYIGSNTPDMHSSYSFQTGVKYGIVYFGGGVENYSGTMLPYPINGSNNKYYFFPSEVNLITSVGTNGYNNLIPINPSDAIIQSLEEQFKVVVSSEPYLWDNK